MSKVVIVNYTIQDAFKIPDSIDLEDRSVVKFWGVTFNKLYIYFVDGTVKEIESVGWIDEFDYERPTGEPEVDYAHNYGLEEEEEEIEVLCEDCGNNCEPNGECFDCEIASEEEEDEDEDNKKKCEMCDYVFDEKRWFECPVCDGDIELDEDMCDCCVKGWDKENEWGRCDCLCARGCGLLRDCKYKCLDKSDDHTKTCKKCGEEFEDYLNTDICDTCYEALQ